MNGKITTLNNSSAEHCHGLLTGMDDGQAVSEQDEAGVPTTTPLRHVPWVVYHLVGKTRWSTVVLNGTRQYNIFPDWKFPQGCARSIYESVPKIIERAWN